jgi:16S rRNA (uracil1498-N3)-methyltransferase
MHRFYLPPECCKGGVLQLKDGEAHHATRVLRIQQGETVTVCDGVGHHIMCSVLDVSRNRVDLQVREVKTTPTPPWELTLLQAVPKGKLFDSIIQKATELGVHRIVPLLSERVALQVDPDSVTQKTAKWRHVAIESIKQCGSGWLPRVEEPISPARFAARQEPFDLQLVAALQPESCHLRAVLDQYHVREQRPPKSVCIWVGPEGDFTPDEYRLIRQCGARAITLGHLVLRVETASTYSLAVINHELQARHDFVVSRTF